MPESFAAVPSPFIKMYLAICSFLNYWIVKLKIPTKLLSSPQKKRDAVNKIGDAGEDDKACNIRVRVMKATNLPAMDGSGAKGTTDAYVKVKLGSKSFQTQPVTQTLNPDFSSEFSFESRQDATGEVCFEIWDSDTDADDFIGKFSIPISKIIAAKKMERAFEIYDKTGMVPVKCHLTRKPTKLRLQISWDTDNGGGDSEWLNGILRKGYRCFAPDVDKKVKEVLTASFANLKLPVVTMQLESMSIGDEAPYFNELRILPTRSKFDLQLRAHLRWVASGDFGIKVRAQTKLGLSIAVAVNNLEIDFPVWIQAHLTEDPAKPLSLIQLAATAEPKIRFTLALGAFSTNSFPGIEEGIDFVIRTALKKVLVLPKKYRMEMIPGRVIAHSPMEKAAIARLSIKVLEAEDVEKTQLHDKLNPYIIMTAKGGKCGDTTRQTKAVNATPANNCEWNEFHEFLISDEQAESVEFQLMDKDPLNADDACGKFVLPIAELAQAAEAGAGWREDWFQLTNCKTGRIKIAIEYARLVPDDGPTQIDRANKKKVATPAMPKEDDFGELVLQVVKASGMPKTMLGGKPNIYCNVSYPTYAGEARGATRQIENDCNPEWNEDFVFREKIKVDVSKQADKEITVLVNDGSESKMGNPLLGKVTLKLKDVLAKPGEFKLDILDKNGKQIGDQATIIIQARFEKVASDPLAAVGSDWLNGILLKGWRAMTDKIEQTVKESVDKKLDNLLHPEPNPETGETPSCAVALKIYESATLEEFELGEDPPFFLDMSINNTRSNQDVQLNAHLRWVTSGAFSIKIRLKGKTAVPDFTIELSNIEIYLPLWIQVRFAGGGTGLGADMYELAVTEDPIIKLRLSTQAGILPGGISEDFIKSMVQMALRKSLVLPNRMKGVLGTDPKSNKKWAADKVPKTKDWPKDVRTHNGLAGCICDVGVKEGETKNGKTIANVIDPKCPVDPGNYMCACDEKGVPLYDSIQDFKVARLRLDEREKRAVGRLSIKLFEADDLHDPDAWGTVDAFVEVSILGTGQKKISSTVNNDTAPVWSEMMDFLVVDEENEVVSFKIYDRDLFKNDFLGEVEVPIKDLANKSGWKEAWMPLQKNTGGGEVRIGLCYAQLDPNDGPAPPNTFVDEAESDVTTRDLDEEEVSPYTGKLMVTVSKAENLVKMDSSWTGAGLDPYVVLDFGRQNKKTKTLDSLNPIWNQTFGFDCKDGGSALVIAVKDEEKLQKDRTIGIRTIKMEDLMDRPGKKWVDSFRLVNPDDRQECKNAEGQISLVYLSVQYIEEGGAIPAEPPAMTGGEGDVVSRSLDAPVAAPPMNTLFVRVIQANDLPKCDWTGSSDPYVSITMSGEGKDKTRVVDANLDPVFGEDFLWQVEGDSAKVLQLTIKDEDKGPKPNEFMGIVEIPVSEIKAAGTITKRAYPVMDQKGKQVTGKSKKLATLTLDIEWK